MCILMGWTYTGHTFKEIVDVQRIPPRKQRIDIRLLVSETKSRPQDTYDRVVNPIQSEVPTQHRRAAAKNGRAIDDR